MHPPLSVQRIGRDPLSLRWLDEEKENNLDFPVAGEAQRGRVSEQSLPGAEKPAVSITAQHGPLTGPGQRAVHGCPGWKPLPGDPNFLVITPIDPA